MKLLKEWDFFRELWKSVYLVWHSGSESSIRQIRLLWSSVLFNFVEPVEPWKLSSACHINYSSSLTRGSRSTFNEIGVEPCQNFHSSKLGSEKKGTRQNLEKLNFVLILVKDRKRPSLVILERIFVSKTCVWLISCFLCHI